jgi:hypothetical protein
MSKDQVSRICRELDGQVEAFRTRPLEGAYPYLWLDAWVVQHIQDDETAAGLIDDGREIFGCEPAFVSEVGAVLGAHVGPGPLGVGSASKDVLS